jgi:glycosyltransferase involved in cell wall biosynthesis
VPGGAERVAVPDGLRGAAARMAWREARLGRVLKTARADAVLVPNPELPLRPLPVPSAVVVHDVFPLVAPELTGRAKRLRFQALLPLVCRRASHVVCVSEATRGGLLETVGVDPSKTHVIGEGPSAFTALSPAPPADPAAPYLLYVGELYKRKNLTTLLAALRRLPDLELRMVGPARSETLDQLNRQLAAWGLERRVRHLGFVSDQELADLHAGALALVLPSLEEGFGRPVADALTVGTPVVASDIPAIREVAGDAALLVSDPLDSEAWAAALSAIAADGVPRARSERFSWDAVARGFVVEVLGATARAARGSCAFPSR